MFLVLIYVHGGLGSGVGQSSQESRMERQPPAKKPRLPRSAVHGEFEQIQGLFNAR